MRFVVTAILCILFFRAFPAFSDEKKIDDSVLATVNGEAITLLDVISRSAPDEKWIPLVYRGKELSEEMLALRNRTLENIIDRKLIYTEFRRRGHRIPGQMLEETIDRIAAEMTGGNRERLEKRLFDSGKTMEDLRQMASERLAFEMMLAEFCARRAFVTPLEVKEYYESNPEKFAVPAAVRLQMIMIRKDGEHRADPKGFTEQIRRNITADTVSFSECAKKFSDGPRKDDGGDIGWIKKSSLRKEFADAVADLRKSQISHVIDTPDACFILKLLDLKKTCISPFDQVKEKLRERLYLNKKDELYRKLIGPLRDKAVIRYFTSIP